MFTRYPRFDIGGLKVQVLGDTHLGRRFRTGVPLHRAGDRERMIVEDFRSYFHDLDGVDVHVHMGDIFDKPIVSPTDVALAADAYLEAAAKYPNCMFFILRGNHDASKDLEAVTSFDLLKRILYHCTRENLITVSSAPLCYKGMMFCPWHPTISAQEIAKQSKGATQVAFGHWDVVNPQSDHNLIPDIPSVEYYVTGHDHRRRMEQAHGKPVHVVGSMQPFTHAEDWTGEFYRTVSTQELSSLDTKNLCVRVKLEPGEDVPQDIDAYQVTFVRAQEETEIAEIVTLDGLDMNATLTDAMTDEGVNTELQTLIMEKYRA